MLLTNRRPDLLSPSMAALSIAGNEPAEILSFKSLVVKIAMLIVNKLIASWCPVIKKILFLIRGKRGTLTSLTTR